MLQCALSLALSYLVGSIPTSYIFTRFIRKVDIRQHGSGNAGATNVFRVVGKGPAIIVLLLDILKGVIAVLLFSHLFYNSVIDTSLGLEVYRILLGACAIIGHIWSVFLKFSGGKGVATTAGVLLAVAPETFLAGMLVWVLLFAIFRIVSVASIAAAICLPVFAILFGRSMAFVAFSAIICIMGTYKHKANIRRIIRGEEKRLF